MPKLLINLVHGYLGSVLEGFLETTGQNLYVAEVLLTCEAHHFTVAPHTTNSGARPTAHLWLEGMGGP